MMNKRNFNGLIAAPFTPMFTDGSVNTSIIEPYARHLINSKVTGVFICGTTGEGSSLTTEERKTVLEEWIRQAQGKLKIICHVGSNSLPQSRELAVHAQKSGADAVGILSPSFFKPANSKELVSFLAPIASSAPDIPFYYYHMPSLTGVYLPVFELLTDVDGIIPNFAGVKYTHNDLFDMQRCIAYGNGKFEILHGYDEILLCGLCLGVESAVGSTYNYMPALYLKLMKAFASNDISAARQLQQMSVQIVSILIKHGGGVRAGKAIMDIIGIDCGPCRLPIRELLKEEKEMIKQELTENAFFNFIKG